MTTKRSSKAPQKAAEEGARAQGLPAKVTDQAAVRCVATLLRPTGGDAVNEGTDYAFQITAPRTPRWAISSRNPRRYRVPVTIEMLQAVLTASCRPATATAADPAAVSPANPRPTARPSSSTTAR